MADSGINVEYHPFQPFLPTKAKVLILGSFPPQAKRWDMPFYYPNRQNDFWRILGLLFFHDKKHFLDTEGHYNQQGIQDFLISRGIALYDTASAVRRLQDNASDKYLEVVEPTDIDLLLKQIPLCQAIVTTGEKATSLVCERYQVKMPKLGSCVCFNSLGREIRLYRMPSTSRAYPLSIEKKSLSYQEMFHDIGLL
ncbi:MAG: uracil-DNA glycosylase family protein [Bacteroidaceae bacterium]|nr:uracil-DNA glycosylase family protein [Bacteroidaceae bacterium]